MFDIDTLKDLLARKDLSTKQKLMLCLAQDPLQPKSVADIKQSAASLGLREIKSWNVSDYLSRCKPNVVRSDGGWELTETGKKHIRELAGPLLPDVTPLVISSLRKQLPTISNANCRSFVEESIRAFEAKLYRSAIVLCWVGAVAVLYDHIVENHLSAFNSEALKRDAKWRSAKTSDDLARMKEHEFLQILAATSVIGKNVKDELEVCLKLRNGCGHPNSLVVGELKASAHIETLMQNIYSKY